MSSGLVNSSYLPSHEALVGSIDQKRVYAWLGIQLLVTLLSIIYLIYQSESKYPLIGDTSLTAFYLDTSGVHKNDSRNLFKTGVVKIIQTGDQLTLKIAEPMEPTDKA